MYSTVRLPFSFLPSFISRHTLLLLLSQEKEMGNCQAVDAAALVLQQPCGRIERHYAPIPASDVMKMHPGHYVSVIIPLQPDNDKSNRSDDRTTTVRFTRVKLLRPNETLTLGHSYRLITTQGTRIVRDGHLLSLSLSIDRLIVCVVC